MTTHLEKRLDDRCDHSTVYLVQNKMKKTSRAPVTIEDFIDTVLVGCPRCSELATVTSTQRPRQARLVCTRCGLAKSEQIVSYTVGEANDPYFHLPLWLQAPCATHTVWAYNPDHLAFLKHHVEGIDRRRPPRSPTGEVNRLLTSRLPRWMQLSKNRDQVMKAIRAMESKLKADS